MMDPIDIQVIFYHGNTLLRPQDREWTPPGCWETIRLDFVDDFRENKIFDILVQKIFFEKFCFSKSGWGRGEAWWKNNFDHFF